MVAGWDAKEMKNKKKSKYSRRKYKRYKKGVLEEIQRTEEVEVYPLYY
ncbi:MAG: hypothetical protein QHH19_03965 [Candidatus Thermoplasmatota archaeon]|jgi:hypothetical protein|nr:hypothetical protein [Candidatus Thermoplasmatota archaeon]